MSEPIQDQDINKTILENVPVSILIIRPDGVVTNENPFFRTMSDTVSLLGKNIFESPFFIRERLVGRYRALFRDGIPFTANACETRDLKNQVKFIDISAVPLKDPRGAVYGALSMALDTTENELQRRMLETLNRELEQKVVQFQATEVELRHQSTLNQILNQEMENKVRERTGELDRVNKRLSDILELKTRYIAEASHELRTPLTVIHGNLDLAALQSPDQSALMAETQEQIMDEVKRMGAIISDLTMLTNVEFNSEQLAFEQLDLSLLVAGAVRSLKVLAEQKGVELRHRASGPLTVWGDAVKLEKAVMNIIRNAIKYTGPNGTIDVDIAPHEPGVAVTVADTGIGIPPEDLPHIFERFYRVDQARRGPESGSGLGLSIAKWIIEAHGGTIEAESTSGKGSTFTLFIPTDHRALRQGSTLFS